MSYRAQKILWSPPRQRMLPEDGTDAREPRGPFSARKIAPATPEIAPAPSRKWNLAPVAQGQPTPPPDAISGPTRNTEAEQDTPKGPDRAEGTTSLSARTVKSVEKAGDAKEKVVPSEKCSERALRPSSEPLQPSSPLRPSRGKLLPMRRGERSGHLTRQGLSCPDICAPGISATVNCRLSMASSRSSVHDELDDSAAMERSFSLVSRPNARGWGLQRGTRMISCCWICESPSGRVTSAADMRGARRAVYSNCLGRHTISFKLSPRANKCSRTTLTIDGMPARFRCTSCRY